MKVKQTLKIQKGRTMKRIIKKQTTKNNQSNNKKKHNKNNGLKYIKTHKQQ